MSQDIILDNLTKYLRHNVRIIPFPQPELLQEGHCFGFSLIFNIMANLNKLNWWLDILYHAANWDGRYETLDENVDIIGSDHYQSLSRLEICEIVLTYLVAHHPATLSKISTNSTISEVNILTPEASTYLQSTHATLAYHPGGTVRPILYNEKIAGYFSLQRLEAVLNCIDFSSNSNCMVMDNSHAITINKISSLYLLYDPNFNHKKRLSVYRTFDNITALSNAIMRRLGKLLFINVGYSIIPTEETRLSIYIKNLTAEQIERYIESKGLHIAAHFAPNFLMLALKNMASAQAHDHDEPCYVALADTLVQNDYFDENILDILIYKPALLLQLLTVIANSKHCSTSFVCLLMYNNKSLTDGAGVSYFQTLATLTVNHPNIVFTIFNNTANGPYILSELLCAHDKKHDTGLNAILIHASNWLPSILALNQHPIHLGSNLVKALVSVNNANKSGFSYLLQHGREYFFDIMTIILSDAENKKTLLNYLQQKSHSRRTNQERLFERYPELKLEFNSLLSPNPVGYWVDHFVKSIANAETITDVNNILTYLQEHSYINWSSRLAVYQPNNDGTPINGYEMLLMNAQEKIMALRWIKKINTPVNARGTLFYIEEIPTHITPVDASPCLNMSSNKN